jgi:hypothetical protein
LYAADKTARKPQLKNLHRTTTRRTAAKAEFLKFSASNTGKNRRNADGRILKARKHGTR